MNTDLQTLSDAELQALSLDVENEVSRRAVLATIPQQITDLNRSYQVSNGYEDGQPWVQPQGMVGSYMEGDVVTHNEAEWLSLIDFNITEPGNPADPQAYRWWENLTDQPADGEWAPGVTYEIGQEVTYDGAEYTCTQGHTSQPGWEPPNAPALWQPVDPRTGGAWTAPARQGT